MLTIHELHRAKQDRFGVSRPVLIANWRVCP